jgi:hypothetical protein
MLALKQAGVMRCGISVRGTPTKHRELGRYVVAHRKILLVTSVCVNRFGGTRKSLDELVAVVERFVSAGEQREASRCGHVQDLRHIQDSRRL